MAVFENHPPEIYLLTHLLKSRHSRFVEILLKYFFVGNDIEHIVIGITADIFLTNCKGKVMLKLMLLSFVMLSDGFVPKKNIHLVSNPYPHSEVTESSRLCAYHRDVQKIENAKTNVDIKNIFCTVNKQLLKVGLYLPGLALTGAGVGTTFGGLILGTFIPPIGEPIKAAGIMVGIVGVALADLGGDDGYSIYSDESCYQKALHQKYYMPLNLLSDQIQELKSQIETEMSSSNELVSFNKKHAKSIMANGLNKSSPKAELLFDRIFASEDSTILASDFVEKTRELREESYMLLGLNNDEGLNVMMNAVILDFYNECLVFDPESQISFQLE
ncbi:MAG: hypothetical protein AB8G05_08030 [Oligoflexales bacterium]